MGFRTINVKPIIIWWQPELVRIQKILLAAKKGIQRVSSQLTRL